MISKYNHKELNWVDLESPKEEEILHVIEQNFIPNDVRDKIISNNKKEDIYINNDYIYVSMSNKLIFFINDDLVLTIHNEPIQAFDNFFRELELDVVGEGKINNHKLLLAYLIKNLYIHSQKQLIVNESQIKKLHSQINKNYKKIQNLIIITLLLIVLLIISIWL